MPAEHHLLDSLLTSLLGFAAQMGSAFPGGPLPVGGGSDGHDLPPPGHDANDYDPLDPAGMTAAAGKSPFIGAPATPALVPSSAAGASDPSSSGDGGQEQAKELDEVTLILQYSVSLSSSFSVWQV